MKTCRTKAIVTPALLAVLAINQQLSTLRGQGTAFTYQGRLQSNGSPAYGAYDLTFTLFDNSSGGTVIGPPSTNSTVPVSNGLIVVLFFF